MVLEHVAVQEHMTESITRVHFVSLAGFEWKDSETNVSVYTCTMVADFHDTRAGCANLYLPRKCQRQGLLCRYHVRTRSAKRQVYRLVWAELVQKRAFEPSPPC